MTPNGLLLRSLQQRGPPLRLMDPRGVAPSKWGACGWSMLHYIALGYPSSRPSALVRRQYGEFFRCLVGVLPCEMCRDNLRRHSTHAPPDKALAEGRDALFDWTVRLHNIVNRETGKEPIDARAARLVYSAGPVCTCSPPGLFAADAVTLILAAAIVLLLTGAVLRK